MLQHTDTEWVARVRVDVKRELGGQLLSGSDDVRIHREGGVRHTNVHQAVMTVDAGEDLIGCIVMVRGRDEVLNLVCTGQNSAAYSDVGCTFV